MDGRSMTKRRTKRYAQICECGSHGFISFPTGHVALIDACKVPDLAGVTWSLSHPFRRDRYVHNSASKTILHRLLAGVHGVPGFVVDHRNGDTMDNRLSNLRPCTHAENTRNTRKHKAKSSKFKGVFRAGKYWGVEVNCQLQRVRKDGFRTELEAALFYDEAAIRLHGEFARTNASLGLINGKRDPSGSFVAAVINGDDRALEILGRQE